MRDPGDFHALGCAFAGNRHCAVIYADRHGAIAFWNAGAESLFGHSAAEVAGKRVDVIVPEDYRERHWRGFNRTIGSDWRGSEGWGPIEGLHRNGAHIALEVFLTPVQEEDARVAGVVAMFRAPA